MAAQTDQVCPSCKAEHTFIYEEGDIFEPGCQYEFTCPTNGRNDTIAFSDWNKVVYVRPPGAVRVRKASN